MERNYVIQTKNLTKDYAVKKRTDAAETGTGAARVVNRVDLAVPEGAVYGFLGPNGSGKSTTMKMLLGLIKPTDGDITILGTSLVSNGRSTMQERDRLAILKQTGSLIESPSYYGHLTGRENLQILCRLKNVLESEIDEVLSLVRMERQQNKKAGKYSLGMKQRLGLAGALLGSPKLLLLDEPTNGLDPAGIQEMRDLIRTLPQNRHMTVMVSSHLLSEIDQMVDYVGVINKGQLIYQDSLLQVPPTRNNRYNFSSETDEDGNLIHGASAKPIVEGDTLKTTLDIFGDYDHMSGDDITDPTDPDYEFVGGYTLKEMLTRKTWLNPRNNWRTIFELESDPEKEKDK